MHKILRTALTDATGLSEYVIVVVADVRGFSGFSQKHESPDIAMYIKRVYMKLIDGYFAFASFYKPTGDGLLVTVPYNEKNLAEVAQRTVESCLQCVDQFGSICQDDPMINFATPDKVGFGLARGTCCCLTSQDKVLDFSGHLLNLATRLMGLARPSGVVLDGAFGVELLKPETKGLFEEADVYLRSLAEERPVKVFYQKGKVDIPEDAKRPLATKRWDFWSYTLKLHQWEKLGPFYRAPGTGLSQRPVSPVLTAIFPAKTRGKILKGISSSSTRSDWEYLEFGGKFYFRLNLEALVLHLKSEGVSSKSPVTLRIDYVPKE
jgi:class 3 adenylate cyclase